MHNINIAIIVTTITIITIIEIPTFIIKGDFLEEIIEKAEAELLSIFCKEGEENMDLLKKSCLLWGWMTKALVARNHGKQTIFSNQVFNS